MVVYRQSVHKNPLHAAQEAKQVYSQLKILYENTLDKRIFWENLHQFILEFEELETGQRSPTSTVSNTKPVSTQLNRSNTLVSRIYLCNVYSPSVSQ